MTKKVKLMVELGLGLDLLKRGFDWPLIYTVSCFDLGVCFVKFFMIFLFLLKVAASESAFVYLENLGVGFPV